MMNESEGNSGEPASLSRPTSQLAGLPTRRASNRQRRIWSRRVTSWEDYRFCSVAEVGLVTAARPGPSGRGVAGPLAGARGSTAWPPMNQ